MNNRTTLTGDDYCREDFLRAEDRERIELRERVAALPYCRTTVQIEEDRRAVESPEITL